MTTLEIKSQLIQSIDRVVSTLVPGGKMSSGRYVAGSIDGGEGHSFSMVMSGQNAGAWKDFATNQDGDILKLFYYKCGEDYKEMISSAMKFLGVTNMSGMQQPAVKNQYTKPKVTWIDLDKKSKAFKFLTEERKIPEDILLSFDVKQSPDGNSYVLLFKAPNSKAICLSKTVSINRDKDGKKQMFASKDGLWCLFGIHPTHTYEHDSIVITEGELDALSYEAEGIRAVSVPGGVGNLKWIDNSYGFWSKFNTIYLSFDMDDAGSTGLDSIISRLGVSRCRVVSLPRKDANKCRQDGIALKPFIEGAKAIAPSKLVSCEQLSSKMWDAVSAGRREEQGILFMGWEGYDSINFRIRPKELTIYTGYPGHGKSAMLYQLAAYLIGSHGHKIAIASLEEPAETIANLILFAMVNKVIDSDSPDNRALFDMGMETLGKNLFLYHHLGQAPLEEIVEFAEYCVRRHGCQHVIIDSVAKTNLDIEDNKQANEFAETITKSMNETGAHYHLVAHARKGDSGDIKRIPGQDDIKGSVQFSITAFNIVTVWKNELKIDLMNSGHRETKSGEDLASSWGDGKIRVCKQKVGGKTGEFNVFYNSSNYRFRRDYEGRDYPYINLSGPF